MAAGVNGDNTAALQPQVEGPNGQGAGIDAAPGQQQPRGERGPRRERGDRGDRNSRGGERGPRNADTQDKTAQAAMPADFVDTAPLTSLPDLDLSAADVQSGTTGGQMDSGAQGGPATEEQQRRERRSRDRYGRDRRERGPRDSEAAAPAMLDVDPAQGDTSATATAPAPAPALAQDDAPRRSYFNAPTAESAAPAPEAPAAVAPAPVVAAPIAAPQTPVMVTAPAPAVNAAPAATAPVAPVAAAVQAPAAAPVAAAGMPRVQAFALPIEALQQVAASSGLQWVNSDADKIAAVQAAIAAEPKPVRVPRERPPVVVVDEGPLVLVETRRDLSATKLPFEQPPVA